MSKFISTGALIAAILTANAAAADNHNTIDVSGTAQQITKVGNPAGQLNFNNLLNANALVKESNKTITFPALANYKAKLKISSTNSGLKSGLSTSEAAAAETNGFLTKVNYKADATFGLTTTQLDTASVSEKIVDLDGPTVGDIVLKVSLPAGTIPVAAAEYSDIITVALAASF